MASQDLTHDVIHIEKPMQVPPSWVFEAWANPLARQIWGPPSKDQQIVFEKADFRPGGMEVAKCGPKGDLRFRVDTHYLHIVQDRLVIFTEKVVHDDMLLSTALLSVSLKDGDKGGTNLDLSIHITSLCGREMIDGYHTGWDSALDNLARHLKVKS